TVDVEDNAKYLPQDEVPRDARVLKLSGTELRQRLNEGHLIPDWFTYSEVIQELRRSFPPRHQQGFTVFFTGLSSAGKSTVANVLLINSTKSGADPLRFLTAILSGSICPPSLVFPANIATSTFDASDTSLPRSPRTGESPSALRLLHMIPPGRRSAP